MVATTTKRRIIIATLIFAGVVTAVIALALYVAYAGDQLRERTQVIRDHKAEEELLLKLQTQVEDTAAARDTVTASVLNRNQVIDFLAMLESFNTGAVTVTVNTINEADMESFSTLRIPLSIVGEEAAVMQVLRIFEVLPYASYLDSLRFSSSDEDGYQASVTLVVAVTSEL